MQCSHTIGRTRLLPKVRFHPRAIALAIAAVMGFWGCGGGSIGPTSSTPTPTPSPSTSVTVTPNSVTLSQGATLSFAATVTGTTDTAVIWSVQENGGGMIDCTGLYTAPQGANGTFHVVATSQANSDAQGIAAVAVPTPQVAISPAAVTLPPNGTQTFTETVAGLCQSQCDLDDRGDRWGADKRRWILYRAGRCRLLSRNRHQHRKHDPHREFHRYRDDLLE